MNRNKLFLLVVMVFFASSVFAATGITVVATKGNDTELKVNVPIFKLEKVDVAGRSALQVSIPGANQTFEKNAPELPNLTALVMIDSKKNPTVTVSETQSEIVQLDRPVVPSRGNFSREIAPESVPFIYGDVYSEDRWYPSDDKLATIEAPFIFHDIRGVRLSVCPIQYNPVKNVLKIHRRFKVSITGKGGNSRNTISKPSRISSVFEPLYKQAFINFRHLTKDLPRLEENGRLLIVCYDDFVGAMTPFIAWKKKCGIDVTLAKASEAGKTAAEIKAFIQQEYNKGGLTHILLVGDAPQIPTLKGVRENADSDPCYTKLAGDDHVPDCIISRLSATTEAEVAYQVAKFVNYEQFPSTGLAASWYSKAMGIASNEGNPTDAVRADWLRNALLKWKITSVDQIYDPKATKAMVSDGVNEGRSMINYIGHGSNTSWGTTYFNNQDCGKLVNGWKLPIIWSVACVNGNFVKLECFCEAWLKAGSIDKPAGAAAIFGATTNQEWVPPCIVQSEIVINYTVNEMYKTVGGLAMNGIIKGLETYGTDPKGSGVMMFEQWHLFGDCTMLARFKEPVAVSVKTETVNSDEKSMVTVKVIDIDGKAVPKARVCLYTEKYETTGFGVANDSGEVRIALPVKAGTTGYVTVTGASLVPVVDQKVTF